MYNLCTMKTEETESSPSALSALKDAKPTGFGTSTGTTAVASDKVRSIIKYVTPLSKSLLSASGVYLSSRLFLMSAWGLMLAYTCHQISGARREIVGMSSRVAVRIAKPSGFLAFDKEEEEDDEDDDVDAIADARNAKDADRFSGDPVFRLNDPPGVRTSQEELILNAVV